MACCGQSRTQISRPVPNRRADIPALPPHLNRPAHPRTVAFQYVGKTALTVLGPVSGWHYRFNHAGAIVEVDDRDRASLAAIPNLRQI